MKDLFIPALSSALLLCSAVAVALEPEPFSTDKFVDKPIVSVSVLDSPLASPEEMKKSGLAQEPEEGKSLQQMQIFLEEEKMAITETPEELLPPLVLRPHNAGRVGMGPRGRGPRPGILLGRLRNFDHPFPPQSQADVDSGQVKLVLLRRLLEAHGAQNTTQIEALQTALNQLHPLEPPAHERQS